MFLKNLSLLIISLFSLNIYSKYFHQGMWKKSCSTGKYRTKVVHGSTKIKNGKVIFTKPYARS